MWNVDNLWMEREKINPTEGLPLEIFEWISSMVPIANVDLLILNERKEILLSWRDDEYYGQGWHIPGGCIRFKETIEDRLQKTAKSEIGTKVITDYVPIATREVIMGKGQAFPVKRAHNISILYECRLPNGFKITNKDKEEKTAGYLRWFREIPENILQVHDVYFDIFMKYQLMRDEHKL